MKSVDVLPQEAMAIESIENPSSPFHWIMARGCLSAVQDLADHFCDVVEIRCHDRVVRKTVSRFIDRSKDSTQIRYRSGMLTEEQVREVRVMLREGKSNSEAARETGVSDTTVRGIRNGRRYMGYGLIGDDHE